MLPNKGFILNKPEEMLLEQFSPYSRNMEFYNELIQGRTGLIKFDPTVLSGPILRIDQFWKFSYTWWLVVMTTKDIYTYDFSSKRYDILTPVYTTGTIEVQAGTPTILRGDGTLWLANLKVGDFVKIGAAGIHTGSTWYEVLTVDSDTQITLTTAAPATAAGTAYVGRQCFTGSNINYWSSITFQDLSKGETWIGVNGKDLPVYWNGTGQVKVLTGLSTAFAAAKYVQTYKNRVLFAWTVEGGQNQPQRERWSDVGNCCSWPDINFHDFLDEDTWISGICNFNDYHIVFKEYEAYVGRHVGGDYIFEFEKSTTCVGAKSFQSIVPKQDYIYYFGRDNEFHRWNLLRDDSISNQILPETRDFDPNKEEYVYGWDAIVKHQIRWHCARSGASYNNYTVVYDYVNDILQVWEYKNPQALCSIGEYLNIADLYVDDSVWGEYYVDEQDDYWDSRYFLSNAIIVVYGGYDGIVRNSDIGYEDDGYEYTRTFRSARMNYGKPDYFKRLWKQEFWFEDGLAPDTVDIKIRKDDNTGWEILTKNVSLYSGSKDVIKKIVEWNKEARNFQIEINSTNHFSMLGWLNLIFLKRKVK